jgi:hypothetical protein
MLSTGNNHCVYSSEFGAQSAVIDNWLQPEIGTVPTLSPRSRAAIRINWELVHGNETTGVKFKLNSQNSINVTPLVELLSVLDRGVVSLLLQ